MNELVGSKIRARRIRLRLTQTELADKMLTIQSKVSRIESGKEIISVETLLAAAVALGVSPGRLLP